MEFIYKNTFLITTTVLLSTLLAIWAIRIDPIINMDATLYLSAAEEFTAGEIRNAFLLYKWPFHSALIAAVHTVSGLSIQNAAYLINIVFQAAMAIGFLACIHALGGSKRTLVIAAIVILLFPSISKYRAFIIRDTGFIACYLWAIFYLIKAIDTQRIAYFIFSSLIMLFGMLFRIEAIAPLLIIPLYLMYLQSSNKSYRYIWLLLTVITSAILFCGLSVWLFGEVAARSDNSISEFFANSMQHAIDNLKFRIEIIREKVLNVLSQKFAPLILIISVSLIVIYEPIRRLAFVYAYLAWYALRNKLVLTDTTIRRVFFALCLVQIILMAIFATINMFLVSRHTLALVLTILLLTPFSLEYYLTQWQQKTNKKMKWGFPTLVVLLLLIGIEGLDVRTHKHDIVNAGAWVKETINSRYSIYSNNALLLHYADRKPAYYNLEFNWKETDFLMSTHKIFDFDYAIIEINKGDAGAANYLKQKLLNTPVSTRKLYTDKLLLIYDLRKVSPNQRSNSAYLKIKP